MSNELITIKELEQQIWETEGIKVEIFPKEGNSYNRMVRPYNYDRLPDNADVNELSKRINKCLEPFIWYYEFKGGIKNMNKEEIKDINEILEIYNKHELPYDIFNPNIYERSKLKEI